MGFINFTDRFSQSCNYQHGFTRLHTSRNTVFINNKIRTTRDHLRSLFILCCFFIGGCAFASGLATRDAPKLKLSTTPVSAAAQVPSITAYISTSSTQLLVETTTSPFDSVTQQFDELTEWRKNCGYKPKSCVIEKFIISGTPFGEIFTTMMANYAENNIHSKPGDGERIIKVQKIEHDKNNLTAIVHGCITDSVVLYMDGGIFNDRVSSSLASWTMQWHDDHWYWTNHQIFKKIYNGDLCES